MKDRYLFKGKRVDNGKWEVGNLVILPSGKYEITNSCVNPPDSDPMWRECVITHDIPLSELIEFDNSSDLEPKRSKALTSYELNIYNTLRDNFDLAITFAEEHLGFHISNEKAKEMLSVFYHSNEWLYPNCTVNNIPFMLCYLQVAINPYGLFIRKDSDLERAIKKAHDLKLIPVKGNLGKSYNKLMPDSDRYLPLSMMIYNHDFKEDNDGTLRESISIRISKNEKQSSDIRDWTTIIDMKVDIPEHEFVRFINSNPPYRNEELQDYAHQLMLPIEE